MKRDLYNALLAWKSSPRRKPLVLRGVRQSGKTWILKQFAKKEFPDFVYLNFEEDQDLHDFFSHKLDPARIIESLALYSGKPIKPESTLILFDEIQASPQALYSLKYFCEEANDYYIAAAGSLLGIRISGKRSFPVGKVNFLDLHPLSFMEFLDALDHSSWRQHIESLDEFTPLPEPLHRELIDLLKRYYVVGGMPEVVDHYARNRELTEVRAVQREILDAYTLDFSKHASSFEIPKISMIWKSIPGQLAKENKKFRYVEVAANARTREYENAMEWLVDAGMVFRSCRVTVPRIPLSGYVKHGFFKLYLADVGLLGAMAGLPVDAVVKGHRLFTEFHGALVENYTAQQLTANHEESLFYWSNQGRAEVDFLVERDGEIYPLEVKAGVSAKSKSLKVFDAKFKPTILSRATLLNLKGEERINNYPLYAISLFPFLSPA